MPLSNAISDSLFVPHSSEAHRPAITGEAEPRIVSESIAPPLLSIVIPVFNEEKTIREIVRRTAELEISKEIIVVDDRSTDGTADLLREFAAAGTIRLALHERNRGKGAALRTGFEQARGAYIAVQDADLEYDPAEFPALLAPLEADEADVVYGSRFLIAGEESSRSLVHRWGNRLLTGLSNRFTGLSLTDMETCHKVFRRSLLNSISLEQDRFGFEPEITAKLARAGARFRELPISYRGRTYADGKKIGLRDLFNAVWCIARYGK